MSEAKHSPAAPVPASEALELIKKRLADLREANAIYRKSEWYRLDEIQRNDREIRWLVDLNTLLRLPAPAAAPTRKDIAKAAFNLAEAVECSVDLDLHPLLKKRVDATKSALRAAPAK